MAQVVANYSAKLTSTAYIFSSPDESSSKAQYSVGTPITLPADYAARMDGEFYPVDAPYGWVLYYEIGDITPNYKTVTDACTAPTSLGLNTTTKILTISGGAGGDLNTFQGYHVSWRDKPIGGSYGSWSSDVTVSSTSTTAKYTVTAPAGYVRQFRARTIGSAGSSYYSAYTTCSTTLTGNTAPSAPTIKRPAASAKTLSTTPVIVVACSADPDGDSMTLKRQIDGGSWTTVKTLTSGTVYDQLPALGTGSHTVAYKLADAYEESSAASVTFTVSAHSWGRTIQTGSVISNKSISHRTDINELLSAVNVQRAFYGLSAISLPGTLGRFGDWKSQMQALQTGITGSAGAAGKTMTWSTVPAYPTASIINQIRTAVKSF